MGRILAIDFGLKRTGIAVTDPLKITPGGLTTVRTHDLENFLSEYIKKENVDIIVFGYPTQMNNQESESMKHIRPFATKIQKKFPDIKVDFYDERFTSKLAQKTILTSGLGKKKRKNKELVDEVSAVIILQSYMDSLDFKNSSFI